MTVFDIRMMNAYRRESPSLETLVAGIAASLGAYRPDVVATSSQHTAPSSVPKQPMPPDPREFIRQRFSGLRFDPDIGASLNAL